MIEVSTSCPSPVRSRWYSAWMTAMADITPLPKSPSAAGCHVGGWSVAQAPISHHVPARAWPIWSLPGSAARGPDASKPRVWQYTMAGLMARAVS